MPELEIKDLKVSVEGRQILKGISLAIDKGEVKAVMPKEFRALLKDKLQVLRMDDSFLSRYINEGFSGGEKKRAEILQMAVLKPEIAILDETDSGLDIDALRIVADGVNAMREPERGFLIITHYRRILQYVRPDFVHIMLDGKIVREGGAELADALEEKGYEWVREQVAAGAS